MIIEGNSYFAVDCQEAHGDGLKITQDNDQNGIDAVFIDKHQATQLIEVLQRWVDGEEIE